MATTRKACAWDAGLADAGVAAKYIDTNIIDATLYCKP
jgi:hypothetical protein